MRKSGAALLFLIGLCVFMAGALAPGWLSAPPGDGAAQAQFLTYDNLFGGKEAETQAAETPETGADDDPDRPKMARSMDLEAYGLLENYETDESMISRTTVGVSVFRQRLASMLERLPTAFEEMDRTLRNSAPDGRSGYYVGVFVVTVLLLLIGRAVVALLAVYLFRPMMIAMQRGPRPRLLSEKLPVLALRVGLTVVAIAINLTVAVGLGFALMQDHAPTAATATIILGAYAFFMLVDTGWRMVISPYLSEYRIPMISDSDARRLYLWVSAAAMTGISTQAFCAWMAELGLSQQLHTLMVIVTNLITMTLILVMIWTNKHAISGAILGGSKRGETPWMSALAAALWAPLATLYLVVAWFEESFRLILGLDRGVSLLGGALLALMVSLIVYALIMFVVERMFERARARARLNAEAAERDRREDAEASMDAEPRSQATAVPASAAPPAPATGASGDEDDDGGDEEGGGGPSPTRRSRRRRAGPAWRNAPASGPSRTSPDARRASSPSAQAPTC